MFLENLFYGSIVLLAILIFGAVCFAIGIGLVWLWETIPFFGPLIASVLGFVGLASFIGWCLK